jgi:SWI/SNF-related matrix-associated actin-dependent regulator 1 of chromatin subfamily A
MNLYPYQQTGAEWLAGRKHALLADEMGLGKSAQAIAACDAIGAERVLVVCPASVVENWGREFSRFSRFGVTIHKVTTKSLRQVVDALVGPLRFDDKERAHRAQKNQDIVHLVEPPSPLRLDAFYGAAAEAFIVAAVDPAAEPGEEVHDIFVRARKGHGPRRKLGVLRSRVDRDPTLAVEYARHVGEYGRLARGAERRVLLSLQSERGAEHLLVPPSESWLTDWEAREDLLERLPLCQAIKGGEKFWVRDPRVGRHRDVLIGSYDAMQRLSELEVDVDVVIADEAHYLKSATAKRTRAIFGEKCDGAGGLVERADRVILLSGTPMPNHPAELWPALRALWPEQITGTSGKPYSYWQFVSKFCKTKDNGFGIQIVGAKNHDLLREKLEPVMLRRLKADVLPDLPEITFEPLFVEGKVTLDEASTHMTWAIAETLDKEGVEGLKRIAPHVATLRRLTGLAKVAPVVEWVREWLEGCDRKIVLFAHHREVIDRLHECFWQIGARVTGDTSAAQRQQEIDDFQHSVTCRVFIGQNTAAGTGVTLTAASDLLMLEPSWTPSDNAQIAGRIHRIGQDRGCQVRFVTLAGSIDEQIGKALARKAADISAILDEPNVEN